MLTMKEFVEKFRSLYNSIDTPSTPRLELDLLASILKRTEGFLVARQQGLVNDHDHRMNLYYSVASLAALYTWHEIHRDKVNDLGAVSLALTYLVSNIIPIYGAVKVYQYLHLELAHGSDFRALVQEVLEIRHAEGFAKMSTLLNEIELELHFTSRAAPEWEMHEMYVSMLSFRMIVVGALRDEKWKTLVVDLEDVNNFLYPFKEGQHKQLVEQLANIWRHIPYATTAPTMHQLSFVLAQFYTALERSQPTISINTRLFSNESPFYAALKKQLAPFKLPANFNTLLKYGIEEGFDPRQIQLATIARRPAA